MHLIIYRTQKYKKNIKANIYLKLKHFIKLAKIRNYLIFTFLSPEETKKLKTKD